MTAPAAAVAESQSAVTAAARQRALHVWATLVYWTGKATGVLVVDETAVVVRDFGAGRQAFAPPPPVVSSGWRSWLRARSWNAACLAAVAYRVHAETWPVTVSAAVLPQASCYDTVCGDVWCVYACVYYAVAWLDRASEACALVVAVTWRRRSTVRCFNSAAAGCLDAEEDEDDSAAGGEEDHDEEDEDDDDDDGPTVADVPWHAYLTVVFPVVQFAVAANAISPARNGVWRAAAATAFAVVSCAPVAAHGTAAALLVVANNSMRFINHRITRLSPVGRRRRVHTERWQRAVIARLARRHWHVAELVTGGVCSAYGMDLMTAVLMAAVRVTYVAVSVFHCLTDDSDARTNMSLAVVMQLIAWFGQFAYLAYTCDELAAQSCEMFDNLNSLLLDIFKESRLCGETYSSKIQEIESKRKLSEEFPGQNNAHRVDVEELPGPSFNSPNVEVQEFMRQVIVQKVIVHACGGLITLNLSLITTIIGVTLTYFIVLLQFESSHSGTQNNTISQ